MIFILYRYLFLDYKYVNSNDNILKPTGTERLLRCWQNNSTEEDGRKLKNIYIDLILKKKCSFSLNLMVKKGKKYFYGL